MKDQSNNIYISACNPYKLISSDFYWKSFFTEKNKLASQFNFIKKHQFCIICLFAHMREDDKNGYHLLGAYDAPDVLVGSSHTLPYIIFTRITPCVADILSPVTGEETKSQRELSKLFKLSNENVS